VAFDCSDLIGRPYRLGADGKSDHIDCIHLVYEVLKRLGIATPPFDKSWYEGDKRQITRDLLGWGYRVDRPEYDGDILLLREDSWAFAVTWQTGILYINRHTEKVAWSPMSMLQACRCFRSRNS